MVKIIFCIIFFTISIKAQDNVLDSLVVELTDNPAQGIIKTVRLNDLSISRKSKKIFVQMKCSFNVNGNELGIKEYNWEYSITSPPAFIKSMFSAEAVDSLKAFMIEKTN